MPTPPTPLTLTVDFGASLIKSRVSDAVGATVGSTITRESPSPCSPQQFVETAVGIAREAGGADRASFGFPGMIRGGVVLSAPLFWSGHRGRGEPDEALVAAWTRFPLQTELEQALCCPVAVANDSVLHAAGVVTGRGVEFVLTLGTGIGTTVVEDGSVGPHLELAHHPLGAAGTYNDFIGDAALARIGVDEWRERVLRTIEIIDRLVFFDTLFVGGGNSRLVRTVNEPRVVLIDPLRALDGGYRLWALPSLASRFYPSG